MKNGTNDLRTHPDPIIGEQWAFSISWRTTCPLRRMIEGQGIREL